MDALATLFERYRRHGDLQALGQVFDALAPRLLAVALHVCGNAADAEDVLQQTFVLAMDRGVAFDSSRRLEPWLAGLLHNVARNARRHAARHSTEPLPEVAHGDAGPIAAAERGELLTLLRTHVDALPAEQRQVLRLQLQHGLSPAEIAVALEVPPGTVRMRIHRGLEALRKLLPAGLAVGAGAVFAGRGLAAVKEAVLHAGRLQTAAAGVTAVAVVGGMLAMKKLAVVCGIAVVLALSVLAWWNGLPAGPAPAVAPSAHGGALVAADAARGTHDAAASAAPAGDRVAAPTPDGSLRVRVTARAGTIVVPSTGVLLELWAGESPLAPFDGDVRRLTTDGAGEVVLGPLVPGPWQVQMPADRDGTPHAVSVLGGSEALLSIERTSRHLARGIVVDGDGTPVAGAEVWIHRGVYMGRYSMPERGELEARLAAHTGDDGRFVVPIFDHEGRLGACHAGYGESFAAYCHGSADELRLVLGRAFSAASGTVRGPDGRPVACALVRLTPAGRDTRRAGDGTLLAPRVDRLVRSDADGRFRFDGVAPGRVRLGASAWPLNPAGQDLDVAAFAPVDVDLVLKEGVSVIGTVRYADGSPARVRLYSTPKLETDGHYCHCDSREDGSYELFYQPRARFFVVVGRHGNITASREFAEPQTGVMRCDFVLAERRGVSGRVRADDGRPLPKWNVVARSENGQRSFARTDAQGNFRAGADRTMGATLLVYPPDGDEEQPALEQACAPNDGQPIELRVPASAMPSASVRGRLVDASGGDVTTWRVTLRNADGEPRGDAIAIAPDGGFEVHDLGDGEYSLVGRRGPMPARRITTFKLTRAQQLDLGGVTLGAFAALRVEFLRADGSPWRGPLPYAHLTDPEGRDVPGGSEPFADGVRFHVAPGTYQVQVRDVDVLAEPQRVELVAGTESTVRMRVVIGRSRKLVWNGDGTWKPKGGEVLHVTVRTAGGGVLVQQDVGELYPDLRGFRYWTLDRVFAFGRYEVEAHSDSGQRYRGTFEVRDDVDDPTRVDVPRVVQ